MISIEAVNYPVDIDRYLNRQELPGERLAKLGLAVAVLDAENNILLLDHEGRDGNFAQGALGPPSETFKEVPSRGSKFLESPLEIAIRCLMEELPATLDDIRRAQLYFSRDSILHEGRWELGTFDDIALYALGMTLQLRTANPSALLTDGISGEAVGKRFLSLEKAVEMPDDEFRPGAKEWIKNLSQYDFFTAPRNKPVIWIEDIELPEVGADIRFDVSDD